MDLVEEAAALRAVAERLAIPGIIDVHSHFMPKPVMDKVWAYFDMAGPLTGAPWPICYRYDEAERLRILRRFGVRAFTSLTYPHKPGMAEWLNGWCADFAAQTPDCLQSATFFPEPEAATYVPAAIDAGARVFKAHLQVGAYDPNDPLLDPVWDTLQQTQVPLVIHCGHGPAAGAFTGPDGMRNLLKRFPRLRLIVAHMGLPDYSDFIDLVEKYDGLFLDTTMAFTDFSETRHPFPVTERGRLVDLGERIVFGSDFPNIPYSYLHAVESVVRVGLGDDWDRAVLHDNAARLFGI